MVAQFWILGCCSIFWSRKKGDFDKLSISPSTALYFLFYFIYYYYFFLKIDFYYWFFNIFGQKVYFCHFLADFLQKTHFSSKLPFFAFRACWDACSASNLAERILGEKITAPEVLENLFFEFIFAGCRRMSTLARALGLVTVRFACCFPLV